MVFTGISLIYESISPKKNTPIGVFFSDRLIGCCVILRFLNIETIIIG